MRDVDLVELTSRVSPTGNFDDRSTFVEMLEASIGVGLERTLVELEVLAWVLALAIGRVGEPYGGCSRIARWQVVADIGPESPDLRPAVARREHRDRRVVGVQLACGHDMIANSFNQRSQQFAGCAHPSGKGRAIQVDAFASIDLRLPVERLMIGILRYQYVGEQTRSREAAVDGARRRRSLHDAIAGIAAQLRPHMADDLEAGPHVLQPYVYRRKRSNTHDWFRGPDGRSPVNPLKQHRQLGAAQRHCSTCRVRPHKASSFKPLGQQT